MDLQELKSKAFDIRAAIDFKQSEIAKLTEEYNKIAPQIFKMEQEAKQPKPEPDIKPAGGYQPECKEEMKNPPKEK